MKKLQPRVSILDPRFKYDNAASTDVGRHLRAHLAEQKRNAKKAAPIAVVQLRRKSASC